MMIQEFTSPGLCAAALADDIAAVLATSLDQNGHASIALSGGRSPQMVLPILAAKPLDWKNVSVTLSDERCVSSDHPDSNARMVQQCFFENGAQAASFYPLWDKEEPNSDGLSAAKAVLAKMPLPIDTMYLGMGEDGHFASLFPCNNVEDFDSSDSPVVSGLASNPPHQRISLSLKTILQARHICLHVTGTAKRRVFDDARNLAPTPECPVSLLLHTADLDLRVFIVE